ncbi:MAG: hypothetical protein VX943_02695, partial [SAR324 cluster bacterium]|nr:hypothetical protein [SAR324 cluster bacterium]
MSLRSILILFRLQVLIIFASSGCTSLQKKIYISHPDSLRKQINMVCSNIDTSNFIVRDLRVWLNQKDGKEIELKHYNSLLPDG